MDSSLEWSNMWNICCSSTKCKIMHIRRKNQEADYGIKINDGNKSGFKEPSNKQKMLKTLMKIKTLHE